MNVNNICNIVQKPGGKNANWIPNRGQQVSVIAHKNLKLAVFLFHHRWRLTLDWEITGVNEDTPNVLPKINKFDVAGTMKAIEELDHVVVL